MVQVTLACTAAVDSRMRIRVRLVVWLWSASCSAASHNDGPSRPKVGLNRRLWWWNAEPSYQRDLEWFVTAVSDEDDGSGPVG